MKIKKVKAIKILDSRGEQTIKVTLETNKGIASACIPQGKSTGKYEAVSVSADQAVKNINQKIFPRIKNKEIEIQQELDKALIHLDGTKNKSKLGANAILGISLAFARAYSRSNNKKLYQYIAELLNKKISDFNNLWLLFNMINGGVHAPHGPEIQEYLVLLKFNHGQGIWQAKTIYQKLKEKLNSGAGDEGGLLITEKNNEKPLEIISETLNELGLSHQSRLGLDIAASQLNQDIDVVSLMKKYNLLYVEDPCGEDNWRAFKKLKEKTKKTDWLIIGDDLTVSNPKRIKKAIKKKAVDGIIIKPNQIGTLSEVLEAIKIAQGEGLKVIISHRSGETCDPFIADLAVGSQAWGLKAGAPQGGERVAKYNRLLDII